MRQNKKNVSIADNGQNEGLERTVRSKTNTLGLTSPDGEVPDNSTISNSENISGKGGNGSAGEMMYKPEYSKIDTGTSGTNIRKDINLEISGSTETDEENK